MAQETNNAGLEPAQLLGEDEDPAATLVAPLIEDFATVLDAPALAEGKLASEHPIARLGSFKDARYGSFSITADDFKAWKTRLESEQNGRIPIDYDHAASKGQTKAAGWITGLRLDGQHVIASIEWTPAGAEAVRNKDYLFVSPEFTSKYTDESGKTVGKALLGVALTNRPFLRKGMPAISLMEAMPFARVEEDVASGMSAEEMHTKMVELGLEPGEPQDRPLDLTFEQLDANRDQFDQAVRALSVAGDLNYMDALERFTDATGGSDEATLSSIVSWVGVDVGAFTREFDRIRLAETANDERIELSAEIEGPGGETDAAGYVLIGNLEARARLLADPVEVERAWLEAKELGHDGDREEFGRDWRLAVEENRDIVATMKLQLHEREVEAKRLQAFDEEYETTARRDAHRDRVVAARKEAEEAAARKGLKLSQLQPPE